VVPTIEDTDHVAIQLYVPSDNPSDKIVVRMVRSFRDTYHKVRVNARVQSW
jgi:hypothetical protein